MSHHIEFPCSCNCDCGGAAIVTASSIATASEAAMAALRCGACGEARHYGPRFNKSASAVSVLRQVRHTVIDDKDAELDRQVAAELAAEHRAERLARMETQWGAYARVTLDHSPEQCRQQYADIRAWVASGHSLLWMDGLPGRGKTAAGFGILSEVLGEKVTARVCIIQWTDLVTALGPQNYATPEVTRRNAKRLQEARDADLLIIDDFGNGDFARAGSASKITAEFRALLDQREPRPVRTVISTNLPVPGSNDANRLINADPETWYRIYSKMQQARQVHFTGVDLRTTDLTIGSLTGAR